MRRLRLAALAVVTAVLVAACGDEYEPMLKVVEKLT